LYLKKNKNKFWRKWHAKFHDCDFDVSINNCVDDYGIANTFRKQFSSVYFDSYMDDFEFTRCLQRLQSSISASDCQYDAFDVSDIERGISALKFGRSAGLDCLTKEHIVYAHQAAVCHTKTLFNAVVSHGFVPDVFDNGVTVPVLKD